MYDRAIIIAEKLIEGANFSEEEIIEGLKMSITEYGSNPSDLFTTIKLMLATGCLYTKLYKRVIQHYTEQTVNMILNN